MRFDASRDDSSGATVDVTTLHVNETPRVQLSHLNRTAGKPLLSRLRERFWRLFTPSLAKPSTTVMPRVADAAVDPLQPRDPRSRRRDFGSGSAAVLACATSCSRRAAADATRCVKGACRCSSWALFVLVGTRRIPVGGDHLSRTGFAPFSLPVIPAHSAPRL